MPLLWLGTLICQMMYSVGSKAVSIFALKLLQVCENIATLPKNIVRYFHLPAGLANGVADDNKPYTSAGYTNVPGYLDHRTFNGSEGQWQPRMNLTGVNVSECTLIC